MENKFFKTALSSSSVSANPEQPKMPFEKPEDFKEMKILGKEDEEKLKIFFRKAAEDPEIRKNFNAIPLNDYMAKKICGAEHKRELFAAHANENSFDGFVYIRPLHYPSHDPILSLFVDSESQGKGIGNNLVRFVIEKSKEAGAKKLRLAVEKDNAAAQNLYKKNGFKIAGEVEGRNSFIYELELETRE